MITCVHHSEILFRRHDHGHRWRRSRWRISQTVIYIDNLFLRFLICTGTWLLVVVVQHGVPLHQLSEGGRFFEHVCK